MQKKKREISSQITKNIWLLVSNMSEVKCESMLCTEVQVNIWNQFWKQSYFVEALSQQLIHEGCPRIIFLRTPWRQSELQKHLEQISR